MQVKEHCHAFLDVLQFTGEAILSCILGRVTTPFLTMHHSMAQHVAMVHTRHGQKLFSWAHKEQAWQLFDVLMAG